MVSHQPSMYLLRHRWPPRGVLAGRLVVFGVLASRDSALTHSPSATSGDPAAWVRRRLPRPGRGRRPSVQAPARQIDPPVGSNLRIRQRDRRRPLRGRTSRKPSARRPRAGYSKRSASPSVLMPDLSAQWSPRSAVQEVAFAPIKSDEAGASNRLASEIKVTPAGTRRQAPCEQGLNLHVS